MHVPKILIVDDEVNIRFVLKHALKHEGYILDCAADGTEAIQKLTNTLSVYDVLLLDLRMEPVDGLQVLQIARQHDPDLVVIILTAYGTLESAVEALRLGAFDYLFKPATPETIRQRIYEAVQQHRQAIQQRQLLCQISTLRQTLNALDDDADLLTFPALNSRFVRSSNLVIDRNHRQAVLAGTPLDLTTAEFDILLCLVRASPTPLPPRALVNHALGYDCEDSEAREIIKWHIHRLRRKIEPDPAHPRHIKTVRSRGYLWSSN